MLRNSRHNKKVLLNTKDFLSVLRRTLIFVKDNKESRNALGFLILKITN